MNVWWLELQFEQEVKSNIRFNTAYDPIHIVEADVERKMDNGIAIMKHAARRAAETGNVSLDEALRKVDDMFGLAREETEEQAKSRKILESIYIYQGQDIKTDEDQKKMIDRRIDDYTKLQKDKQRRDILRQIRKSKDQDEISRLKEEFKRI